MFNALFGYLLECAKDDLLRSIIALYERSDWPQALQHTKGAFTWIANRAEEVGELEVTRIAREMREECMPYFEREVPGSMEGSLATTNTPGQAIGIVPDLWRVSI